VILTFSFVSELVEYLAHSESALPPNRKRRVLLYFYGLEQIWGVFALGRVYLHLDLGVHSQDQSAPRKGSDRPQNFLPAHNSWCCSCRKQLEMVESHELDNVGLTCTYQGPTHQSGLGSLEAVMDSLTFGHVGYSPHMTRPWTQSVKESCPS
jgi:hypothetical protein